MNTQADTKIPSWLPPVRRGRDFIIGCLAITFVARCDSTALCVLFGVVPFAATGRGLDTAFQIMCFLALALTVWGGIMILRKSNSGMRRISSPASPRRELIFASLMVAGVATMLSIFVLHPERMQWSLERYTPLDAMLPYLISLGRMHLLVKPISA